MSRVLFERDLEPEVEKKIKSIAARITKSLNDIKKLGYDSYLSPNHWNIMDGDTHSGQSCAPQHQNIVASFYVTGIDAGDW